MNKIKMLDEKTIQKIAAGEIIERPSSIAKELIEKYVFKKKHLTSSFLDTVGLPVT